MSTYAELAREVQLIGDQNNDNYSVVLQFLRRTENEFIERSQCTEKVTTIDTEDDFTYNIAGVSVASDTFSIAGDKTLIFVAGKKFTVSGSTGNDGTYTVSSVVYTAPNTIISCVTAVPDATVDGTLTLDPQGTYSLPSDFCKELRIEWDGVKLSPTSIASDTAIHESDGETEYTGTPEYYWIEEGVIRLLLKPSSHGILKIWHTYINTSTSGSTPIIPSEDHAKLISGAIMKMLEFNGDESRALYYGKKFDDDIETTFWKYKMRRNKQTHISDVNDAEGGFDTENRSTYVFVET